MSGVIALLMERDPSIDTDSVANLLTSTSIHSGALATIHACRALEMLIDTDVCDNPTARF